MRSLGWALIQCMTSVLIRGNLDADTQREDHVRTQGEDGHLQTQEASEDTNPAVT